MVPTEASHAVIDIDGLDEAIANLSEATGETQPTQRQPEDQVGGSVVGEGRRDRPLRLAGPLRDSTQRGRRAQRSSS